MSAFNDGARARRQGKPASANPFDPSQDMMSFWDWDNGWNSGEE